MFAVIFYGDYSEVKVTQSFYTKQEAESWVESFAYDFTDIAIDKDGNDYWKTFYKYYNPEDEESYSGYDII